MCLIVICHILQYYNNNLCYWFNVGVQIFFIISGYLYGGKAIDNPICFIVRQFKKILIPYYLVLLLIIMTYIIVCPEQLHITSVVKAVFCAGTIQGVGHLWFVGYILLCYALIPYLYWIKESIKERSLRFKITSYLGVLVLLQILGNLFQSYFLPDRLACFLIGYFMIDIRQSCSEQTRKRMVILTISVGIFVNIIRALIPIMNLPVDTTIINGFTRYAHLLLGVSIFLLIIVLSRNVRYNKLLSWSDEYSYHYYLIHGLFILSPLTLLNLTSVSILNCIIAIFVIAVLSVLLRRVTDTISLCGSRKIVECK